MPKMKTHKGAAGRFELTKKNKLKRRKAYYNHMLEKKSPARKRRLKKYDYIAEGAEEKRIKKLLGVK
jgi:large subunit ribosomal protein L35